MFEYLKKKLINDFIKTELCNKSILNDILFITELDNIVKYEYECNQYHVILDRPNNLVIIKDAISEEYGASYDCTRITMSVSDFLNIVKLNVECD